MPEFCRYCEEHHEDCSIPEERVVSKAELLDMIRHWFSEGRAMIGGTYPPCHFEGQRHDADATLRAVLAIISEVPAQQVKEHTSRIHPCFTYREQSNGS